jgi:hypothetical protein
LALDFWLLNHPAGYYRSAGLYEELYHASKDSDKRLPYLARAMVAYFRAGDFKKCAQLSRELSDDSRISVKAREGLPSGMTVTDLRYLGEIAGHAGMLADDDEALLMLTGFLLDWQSQLRLEYVLNHKEARERYAGSQLRQWHDGLAFRLEHDQRETGRVRDPIIRAFLVKTLAKVGADFQGLAASIKQ